MTQMIEFVGNLQKSYNNCIPYIKLRQKKQSMLSKDRRYFLEKIEDVKQRRKIFSKKILSKFQIQKI